MVERKKYWSIDNYTKEALIKEVIEILGFLRESTPENDNARIASILLKKVFINFMGLPESCPFHDGCYEDFIEEVGSG